MQDRCVTVVLRVLRGDTTDQRDQASSLMH